MTKIINEMLRLFLITYFCLLVTVNSFLTLLINTSVADDKSDAVKVDIGGYFRGNIQIGEEWKKGENLRVGSASDPAFSKGMANRLQEGSYLEPFLKANFNKNTSFKFTVATADPDAFTYSNRWGSTFVVREVFLEMKEIFATPKVGLWAGSRMYRGSDIHLFDSWVLDNHNLTGGGVYLNFDGWKSELAVGTKKDISLQNVGSSSLTAESQRTILIDKMEFPIVGKQKIKTNLEYQYVAPTAGNYNNTPTVTGSGVTGVKIPSANGVMIGAQWGIWGDDWYNNIFVNFGFGDVIGGINTNGKTVDTLEGINGGKLDVSGIKSRKDSSAALVGVTGAREISSKSGIMYAGGYHISSPKDMSTSSLVSIAIRPLWYVSGHLHLGIELDAVKYMGREDTPLDVNYLQVAPMLEYVTSKNVWGWPKFRIIAANTFYEHEVNKYGKLTKSAFNVTAGFELVF
ncbi:MAG: carbohydrate porin [Oligoflexia bacterium]|nr:carbohydrate porin [Oligoflexia bacterium]